MASTEAEAADWLERQLTQLAAKLDALIHLRTTKRRALLGDRECDFWSGGKRRQFESDFHPQQTALQALRQEALSLRGTVHDAREKALKDNN
ncbi:hypothetical protein ACH41H_46675 [Streptomyces sp. NPDC020800]|uniref:hypothetical protein n=1 Tax=Streptomyces sp. NPDC020800 TaxID=3365092 RepID=UPI0037B177F4